MFPHTPGDRVLMECCRSVLDCWYLWCRQQRCWDEQLGSLHEVFVLRKAFYLSETKVDCARDLYGPMHKTCMQAYDLCLFFMEDGSKCLPALFFWSLSKTRWHALCISYVQMTIWPAHARDWVPMLWVPDMRPHIWRKKKTVRRFWPPSSSSPVLSASCNPANEISNHLLKGKVKCSDGQ